jgi:glycosyltransferase involved in cell wall biosynthesis
MIAGLFEVCENFCAKRFDAVIAATPVIEERFRKKGCKAVTVHNYPILSEFVAEESTQTKREGRVCYIGGITRVRGVLELVKAAGISRIPLDLAGEFDSAALKTEAANLPGWETVDFHGFVGRTEVADILKRACAGMVTLHPIPNYLESLPIKLFEYMAAGIPFIASDFPYWRGLFGEEACGLFVDPNDPAKIAEAVCWITAHPAEAEEMGLRGKKLAQEKFNWAAEEKTLLGLYAKLTGQPE